MHGIALCAGVGGLELALDLVFGSAYRTVCYVEHEAYAAATLVARMEEGLVAPAAIWDDVRTFDGRSWRGRIHVLTAGFPCQPHSTAGTKQHRADDRWLWPDLARIICDVQPDLVFLENVPPITVSGLGDILGTLAALGMHAEWDCVSAADVGATHRRRRLFILAGPDVGHAALGRWPGLSRRPAEARTTESDSDMAAPGASHPRTCGLFPPGPADLEQWRHVLDESPDLSPALARRTSEGIESVLRRVAHGMAYRVDRLRACGNGVVPLAAAYAFCTLAAHFGLRADLVRNTP